MAHIYQAIHMRLRDAGLPGRRILMEVGMAILFTTILVGTIAFVMGCAYMEELDDRYL